MLILSWGLTCFDSALSLPLNTLQLLAPDLESDHDTASLINYLRDEPDLLGGTFLPLVTETLLFGRLINFCS